MKAKLPLRNKQMIIYFKVNNLNFSQAMSIIVLITNLHLFSLGSYIASMLRDFLISITLYLYKFSRNYRYVHETLSKEKKLLKLKSCGQVSINSHIFHSNFIKLLFFVVNVKTREKRISSQISTRCCPNFFKHCGLH